jgi:hypothetical protein
MSLHESIEENDEELERMNERRSIEIAKLNLRNYLEHSDRDKIESEIFSVLISKVILSNSRAILMFGL